MRKKAFTEEQIALALREVYVRNVLHEKRFPIR